MPANSHLRFVTQLLVAIATVQVQIALSTIQRQTDFVDMGVALAWTFGLWLFARRRTADKWSAKSVAAVLAFGLLPLAWDPVSRLAFGVGRPYETQLTLVLRNATLALAVMPNLPRATMNATVGSLFLVMFCSMWQSGPWAIALLVLYSIIGLWWLLAAYWEELGGRFADSSETAVPLRPVAVTATLLAITLAAAAPVMNRMGATTALAGFFPSSGGTRWSDAHANGGVGDGDQMVAGKEQASSFGPIDCDLYLESKMPSLYDAFSEFSDAPPKKKSKSPRRAIPLAASQVKTNHKKKGLNLQATREFSAFRQQAKRRETVGDRLSSALLHVTGRTPQHLALETFDRWDGHSLIACVDGMPIKKTLRQPDASGRRWAELLIRRPARDYPSTETSQVRVINLKTQRVPTPAGTTAISMKNLHSELMFTTAADGSLAMNAERIPQLTVLDFRSSAIARDARPTLYRSALPDPTGPDLTKPVSTDSRSGGLGGGDTVRRLAREWTRTTPTGWPQVEAIVARLAEHCTHDPAALIPPEVDDAVDYFLVSSRRGPDYMFATTAALMLRSLGYDTRIRAGFYASPKRYDYAARLTPVLMEDAHFWVEVRASAGERITESGKLLPGVWVTVEPTPGYTVRYAPETLIARLKRWATGCLARIVRSPVAALLTVVGCVAAFRVRRHLLDALVWCFWLVRARTDGAGRLTLLTLKLLEWRAWAYHTGRPTGSPIGRWGVLDSHPDFAALASWALYGAASPAPLTTDAARLACRRALMAPLSRTTAPGSKRSHHQEALCKP